MNQKLKFLCFRGIHNSLPSFWLFTKRCGPYGKSQFVPVFFLCVFMFNSIIYGLMQIDSVIYHIRIKCANFKDEVSWDSERCGPLLTRFSLYIRSKVDFKIGFCCHLLCSYKEGLSLANVWYYTVPFSKVDDAIDPE